MPAACTPVACWTRPLPCFAAHDLPTLPAVLQGGASGGPARGDIEAGVPPPSAAAAAGDSPDKHMEEFFKEVAAIKVGAA